MDLKEIDFNTSNWTDSAQIYKLLESPCEWGIEPPSFISYGDSLLDKPPGKILLERP